jgi:hypothetical protein
MAHSGCLQVAQLASVCITAAVVREHLRRLD